MSYPPDYEPEEPAEVDCPECGGSGLLLVLEGTDEDEEVECGNCSGSGKVPNDQLSDWMQYQIRAKRNQY